MENKTPQKSRKLNQSKGPFLTIYAIAAAVGGWRLWHLLHGISTEIPLALYLAAYLFLCALIPISGLLPRTKPAEVLDRIGNQWTCFQLVYFFAAILDWLLEIILVNGFRLMSGADFLVLSSIIFGTATLLSFYGVIHANRIKVTHYECKLPKMPPSCPEMHLVHLSDLHVGGVNPVQTVRKVVEQVNALNPDLVCITGDTFSSELKSVVGLEAYADALSEIKSRYGVYACLGNHDYYSDLDEISAFYQRAGVTLLRDQSIQQAGLTLIGREDRTPEGKRRPDRKPIAELMKDIDSEHPVIVLDHQPGDLQNEMQAGADIVLSGHTHGGQFFPMSFGIRFFFPHYYGLRKFGQMDSIVSSGAGTAIPPIRIGSHGEVVSITLSK